MVMNVSTTMPFTAIATMQSAGVNSATVSFRYFGMSIGLYSILVGSIGNMLTIVAYNSNKQLQTSFNVLVVNLSVVDFITATMMLPFNVAGYVQMKWPFGNDSFTARLQAFSYFSCGYTSVVFLVAITTNRLIGVFWQTKYDSLFRRTRTTMILGFCWTFAPICLLPFLIGTDPSCKNVNHALTGFHPVQFVCTFICLPAAGWNPYMQATRVVFQFLPLAYMVGVYSAVFCYLKRRTKKLKRSLSLGLRSTCFSSSIAAGNNALSETTHSNSRLEDSRYNVKKPPPMKRKPSAVEIKRVQSNRRLLVISVVICFAFMLTFLPSVIVNLLPGRRNFDPRIHMLASNLSWFNSSLNPIIYAILNPRFRKEYIRLIKKALRIAKAALFCNTNEIMLNVRRGSRSENLSTNSSLLQKSRKTSLPESNKL